MVRIRRRSISKYSTPASMSQEGKRHNRMRDFSPERDIFTNSRREYLGMDLKEEKTCRLDSWINGVPAPPLRMSLILTNACNLRCKMCETPVSIQKGWLRLEDEITEEEWLRIVREGAEMGILEWYIRGGGEPFVREELTMAILRTLRKESPNSVIELDTNGSRLTEETLKELVCLGLNRIQISLDFPNAAMHDWMRGQKGTFEKVTRAISKLRELRDLSADRKPRIVTTTVLSGLNCDLIDEIVALAARIGVDQVNVTPLRVMESIRPQVEKARMVMNSEQKHKASVCVERAKRTADKYGILLHFLVDADWEESSGERIEKRGAVKGGIGPQDAAGDISHGFIGLKCYEPWFTLAVDARGNPGYCVAGSLGEQHYNLRRHTLREVWYGEYFLRIRSQLMGKRSPDTCLECDVPYVVTTEGPRILCGLSPAKGGDESIPRRTPAEERILP